MKPINVKKTLQNRAFILPSLVTVVSLFAGFLSIISSIKGNYEQAVKYIALAFIFDGLDGRLARKLNAASPFGREFDSLCDAVAFGVAPAILIWHWIFRSTFDEFGVLLAFLFVAASVTRLARFNIRTGSEPKSYFEGLPVPAAAACVSALVYSLPDAETTHLYAVCVSLLMLLLSGLMVSTFKFTSFKRLSISHVDHRKIMLGLSLLVAFVWVFDRGAIFFLMLGYVASAPLLYLFGKRKAVESETAETDTVLPVSANDASLS